MHLHFGALCRLEETLAQRIKPTSRGQAQPAQSDAEIGKRHASDLALDLNILVVLHLLFWAEIAPQAHAKWAQPLNVRCQREHAAPQCEGPPQSQPTLPAFSDILNSNV